MELLNLSPLGTLVLFIYGLGLAFTVGAIVGTVIEHNNTLCPNHCEPPLMAEHGNWPPSSGSPVVDRCTCKGGWPLADLDPAKPKWHQLGCLYDPRQTWPDPYQTEPERGEVR